MIVEAPDNKTIEFPDSMKPDQVQAAMQKLYPPKKEQPESPGMDAAKSLAGGVERGVAGRVMMLPDLMNSAVEGPQMLGRGIASGVDKLAGIPEQPRGELWKPFVSSEEALQKLPAPLRPHDAKTALGAVADFGGQIAGGNIKAEKPVGALLPKDPTIPASKVKEAANFAYKSADAQGGAIRPDVAEKFYSDATALQTKDAKIAELEKNRPYAKALEEFHVFQGEPLTLERAQYIDERLGDMANGFFGQAGMGKEGKKLLDIQDKFRDMIANTKDQDIVGGKGGFDAWKSGQKLWSESMKMRDIEKIVERASYSDNPALALKSGFKTLAINDKRLRGFSQEDKKLIQDAAKTGSATELLRSLGSRLIPIGHLAGGNIGGALASHVSAAAARDAAAKLQLNRANKVLKSVAGRSFPPSTPQPVSPGAKPGVAAPAASLASELEARKAIGGY